VLDVVVGRAVVFLNRAGYARQKIREAVMRALDFSWLLSISLWLSFAAEASVPFWGAKKPLPIETPPQSLQQGEFTWAAELAPVGPVLVVVSLDEQRAYTYRNGILIGVSTVSTGRKNYETPTGVFVTMLKDKDHHSKKYNNAPMPYTQRITMDGVALHAGGLPGYPSSHGCIHLPSEYARLLFDVSPKSMTVVIADAHSAPQAIDHPAFLAPVKPKGKPADNRRLSATENYRWQPELAPAGPLSIVASRYDKRIVVLRNGVEIGRSKFTLQAADQPWGTHLYSALHSAGSGSPVDWIGVGITGHREDQKVQLDREIIQRMIIPDEFLALLRPVVETGATLMMTDAPVLESTTGQQMTLLTDKSPQEH
jgi:lipoprotein-anchoring transpeptidase ErfK/SrfK